MEKECSKQKRQNKNPKSFLAYEKNSKEVSVLGSKSYKER